MPSPSLDQAIAALKDHAAGDPSGSLPALVQALEQRVTIDQDIGTIAGPASIIGLQINQTIRQEGTPPEVALLLTELLGQLQLSPADRIVLDPAAAPRTIPEALAGVLAVVRDPTATLGLSAEQIRAIIRHPPADLTEYRLGRIAEWSQAHYALDKRFVALTLLVDQGQDAAGGRWSPRPERYDDLRTLLSAVPDPAMVVLGPPGGGKSTLLRRFELDAAIEAIRPSGSSPLPSPVPNHGSGGEGRPPESAPITFFLQLNHYRPAHPAPSPTRTCQPSRVYPIGEDEPIEYYGKTITSHMPRHDVELAPFAIGQFAVTNAEWAHFLAAGGYDDERWWDTAAARRWRRGEGTADGTHADVKYWWRRFVADPERLEASYRDGVYNDMFFERWQRRLTMTEAELDAHLRELYPGGRLTEPGFWRDEAYHNPAQPVVGVCWFEARAYANWLAAQTGLSFRLPTEVEWEAAARGQAGRVHAYGDEFDPLKGNTLETHIKRPTPVGVFVEGDTPEGMSDLTGNTSGWTGSLFGRDDDNPEYGYPYCADDGREDGHARADVLRVVRRGAWNHHRTLARGALRDELRPDDRDNSSGCRLVLSPP